MRLMHIKPIYDYLAEKALNIETIQKIEIKSQERHDTVVDMATRLPNGCPRYHGTIPGSTQGLLFLQNFQNGLGSFSPGVKPPVCEADHSRPTPR
jgi:hypothetical protein